MDRLSIVRFNGRVVQWMAVFLATTQFACVTLAPMQPIQDKQVIDQTKVTLTQTAGATETSVDTGTNMVSVTETETATDIDFKDEDYFTNPGKPEDKRIPKTKMLSQRPNVATTNNVLDYDEVTSASDSSQKGKLLSTKVEPVFPKFDPNLWSSVTSSERRERRFPQGNKNSKDEQRSPLINSEELNLEKMSGIRLQNSDKSQKDSKEPSYKPIDLGILNEMLARNNVFIPPNVKRQNPMRKHIEQAEKDLTDLTSTNNFLQQDAGSRRNGLSKSGHADNNYENAQRAKLEKFVAAHLQDFDPIFLDTEHKEQDTQQNSGAISSGLHNPNKNDADSKQPQTNEKPFKSESFPKSNNEQTVQSPTPRWNSMTMKESTVASEQLDPDNQNFFQENLEIPFRDKDVTFSFEDETKAEDFLPIFNNFHDAPRSKTNRYLQFAVLAKVKMDTFLKAMGLLPDKSSNTTSSLPSKTVDSENKQKLSGEALKIFGLRLRNNLNFDKTFDFSGIESGPLLSAALKRSPQAMSSSPINFVLRPASIKKSDISKSSSQTNNKLTTSSNLKRGRPMCNYQRLNLQMLLEFFHTGKMCGSHVVRMRFGIGK